MTTPDAWQRFLTAARGGEPDRVPVALGVDSPWLPGYAGMNTLDFFLYPDRWLDVHLGLHERFPEVVWFPGFWVEYGMANEPSAFGTTVLWRTDAPPAMRHLDLPPARWGDLRRPDPETDGLMPFVLRRMENLERGELPEPHRIYFASARGPLAVATHVLGTTPFLEATAAEPDAVHAALDIFTETAIRYLQAQLDRLREPLGILLLDDIPGMLSPRAFSRIAQPYLQRVFDAFDGMLRIYHNDTPCAHLLPRLAELHFEIFNFSHEMPIGEVKAALPGKALMGNVAPLDVLVRGTPEQVEHDARLCIEQAAAGGGLILSAGGGVSPGTPAEHIDALVRATHSQ